LINTINEFNLELYFLNALIGQKEKEKDEEEEEEEEGKEAAKKVQIFIIYFI